jgi:hypothetical protein
MVGLVVVYCEAQQALATEPLVEKKIARDDVRWKPSAYGGRQVVTFDQERMTMRSREDYITYREWRERGETVVGAFLRTVPYQYIWGPVALLVIVAVIYLKPRLLS